MNQTKIAKIKAERAKRHRLLNEQQHREGVEANQSLKVAVDKLYEALNDKEPFDVDRLSEQIQALTEVIDIKDQVKEIHEAVKAIKPEFHAEKIDLSPVIQAIEKTRPEKPDPIDFSNFEKAIIEIQQRVQEQPEPDSQNVEDYKPFRRVVKVGNRLIFDDQPTPSRGGGGSSAGLTNTELRATPVDVNLANQLVPENYDYIGVTTPSATSEVYAFKSGGSGGSTVATLTINYTDSSKETLSSVART